MPTKSPPALPWDTFNGLLDRVHQLAQEPGNENLYRFIIFAATVAHYGLRSDEVLSWQWIHTGVYFFDELQRGVLGKYDTNTFRTGDKEVSRTIYLHPDYVKIAHRTFSLVYPDLAKGSISIDEPTLLNSIVPALHSDGSKHLSRKSLNQLLTSTADMVGFNPADISTLALRKTCARHLYDQHGQTKKMLTVIKKHFNHKTLGHTKRFIAFASENGCPPVY